ncbi:MAG: hypothetical protein KIT19_03370 [Phycisphaeraceae bacterium]|nr:hypothetical protein [Phycisphaeraceae bacterium]
MKRTRHSAEQIVSKLREADAMLAAGQSVALGVSEQTFHRWRNQFGALNDEKPPHPHRLRLLHASITNGATTPGAGITATNASVKPL